MLNFNSKAQGTVEYLVIIAVVVVLALVIVGLVVGIFNSPSQQISTSGNDLGLKSQAIGITESLIEPNDGNFVVRLLNNSGENLTISNVKIGDTNVSFSEDLAQGSNKFFRVDTNAVCNEGKIVSQDVIVTYVTRDGLTKSEKYPAKVMFDCSPYTINQANLANQCPGLTSLCSGNAIDANVQSGVTYCNSSGSSTGSLATKYLSPSSTMITAGYYDANNLVTIDSDLNVTNIRSGVDVFGVTGNLSAGVYDANATSAQVLNGYSFFGNSSTKQSGSLWVGSYLHSKQNRCWNRANSEVTCVGLADGNTIYQDAKNDGNVASFTTVGVPAGTVKDNFTGLIWQKDSSNKMYWFAALGYCAQLSLGGYPVGSWRLPSISELVTFADYNCSNVSTNCSGIIINSAFTAPSGWGNCASGYCGYWSSTTVINNITQAYELDSTDGSIYYGDKINAHLLGAKCVRSP